MKNRGSLLIIIILLERSVHVTGKAAFQPSTRNEESSATLNQTMTLNVFDVLPWTHNSGKELITASLLNEKRNSTQLHLVNLNQQLKGFDPCDSSTFPIAKSIISESLASNYNITTSIDGENWVGILDTLTLQQRCNRIPLHFSFPTYAAWSAQRLGASILIMIADDADIIKLHVPFGVDIPTASVWGQVISVQVVAAKNSDVANSITISPEGTSFAVTSIVPDFNANDTLYIPWSLAQLLSTILAVLWFCLSLFIAFVVRQTIRRVAPPVVTPHPDAIEPAVAKSMSVVDIPLPTTQATTSGTRAATRSRVVALRQVILITELMHALARAVWTVDPLGTFGISNYVVGILLSALVKSLSTLTNLASVIYCYDVYSLLRHGRKFKKSESMLIRYKRFVPGILMLSVVMVVTLVLFTYLKLYGLLGNNSSMVGVPTLYSIFTNLVLSLAAFRLSYISKIEIAVVLASHDNDVTPKPAGQAGVALGAASVALDSDPAVAARGARRTIVDNNNTASIRDKVTQFNLMRGYMEKAAMAIIIATCGSVMLIIFPTGYSIGAIVAPILANLTPLIASWYQILAAIHNNSRIALRAGRESSIVGVVLF